MTEFWRFENLSKNFDALVTLVGESDKLAGFVIMTTINKLQLKPDLVMSDDQWEEWSMEVLISNLKKWLRRNKVNDVAKNRKQEGHWYEKSKEPRKSHTVSFVKIVNTGVIKVKQSRDQKTARNYSQKRICVSIVLKQGTKEINVEVVIAESATI